MQASARTSARAQMGPPAALPWRAGTGATRSTGAMCRNIRVLYNFEPPTTEEEIRAAAVQYVRKVSGLRTPPAVDLRTFDEAVAEVAATTQRLLDSLRARTAVRTREGERERARARGRRRAAREPSTG